MDPHLNVQVPIPIQIEILFGGLRKGLTNLVTCKGGCHTLLSVTGCKNGR